MRTTQARQRTLNSSSGKEESSFGERPAPLAGEFRCLQRLQVCLGLETKRKGKSWHSRVTFRLH
eukprot:4774342-Pleurochrysis_carterae.AAC.2